MRSFVAIILFFIIIPLHAQSNSIQELGEALSKAFMSRDSLKLYSLVLPAEGFMEVAEAYKETLPEEAQKQSTADIESVKARYKEAIPLMYAIPYFNQVNKLDIFDLRLENLKFEKVAVPESKELPKVVGVHAAIPHDKFKHFTFYAYPFEEKWYLFSEMISISEENAFAKRKIMQAIEFSEDELGYLEVKGSIPIKNTSASKSEILDCTNTIPASIGIEVREDSSATGGETFAQGAWEYWYTYNGESTGNIQYQIKYTMHEDSIDYAYTHFDHQQGDSSYASVGQLPLKPTDKVLEVFDENLYQKILDDILLNMRIRINIFRKTIDRCLK
ncbi:hypothetical protein POV27_19935 [Aureisphaera galaxeae]|uniref:hypothetical protein n=1 Tax=Aureisphaera galaxeae TaxID=1538023 RepID=UPI0023507719|nr:hypothetical protein [Aureisphaera galaxeae]MDC8006335.1 hypothetical protein [Aureisphaera galaxeae]